MAYELKQEYGLDDCLLKGNIVVSNDKIYLFEYEEYSIVRDKAFRLYVNNEKADCNKLKSDYNARLVFENRIGYSKLKIDDKEFNVQVLSDKVAEIYGLDKGNYENLIEKHEELYEKMIDYIYKKLSVLPFYISSQTYWYVNEYEEQVNILFAYAFLKNKKDEIKQAYEQIINMPHRRLDEKYSMIDVWEASNIDEGMLIDMVSNREYLVKGKIKIVRDYIPEKVYEKRLYDSYDTLENRFVKHFLEELLRWCYEIINILNNKIRLDDIIAIKDMIIDYLNNPIFADVGRLEYIPYNSQILLRREGYRDVFNLWLSFKAYSPFFKELEDAIDSKDIALLYEYFCFFKLIDELKDVYKSDVEIRLEYEPTGELKENIYAKIGLMKVYYNKEFRRPNSYSIPLRPDFSIYKDELIGVFDAKFRLKPKDLDETYAKSEDIYKMHTYRDALRINFAVILYPGDESRFFNENGEIKDDLLIIFNIISNNKGVGYVSTKRWLKYKN